MTEEQLEEALRLRNRIHHCAAAVAILTHLSVDGAIVFMAASVDQVRDVADHHLMKSYELTAEARQVLLLNYKKELADAIKRLKDL